MILNKIVDTQLFAKIIRDLNTERFKELIKTIVKSKTSPGHLKQYYAKLAFFTKIKKKGGLVTELLIDDKLIAKLLHRINGTPKIRSRRNRFCTK